MRSMLVLYNRRENQISRRGGVFRLRLLGLGTPFSASLFVFVLGALSGCAKQNIIPRTKVIDTPLNREIIRVVEKYRQAMERRDAGGVLALAHPTYRDHSGTPQGSDDIDYRGLKEILRTRFKNTTKIRYRIEYQLVRTKGREAEVDTYIDATFVYKDPMKNLRWRRLTDHNRFRLLKDSVGWLFISGL